MLNQWNLFGTMMLIIGVILFVNCQRETDIKVQTEIDLILVNGKIWTGVPQQPWAEAIAIAGERILKIGPGNELQQVATDQTQIIDLKGRFVLPGFNDAHVHFRNGGASLLAIQLRDAKDEAELAARIKAKVTTLQPGEWITGGHWDHEVWPSQKLPNKTMIDSVSAENPVLISRLDGHVALANSLALMLAGVDQNTPDPQGGKIERNSVTGEPTGILWDEAIGLVGRVIPAETSEQVRQAILAALKHAAEVGVTSIQDNSSQLDFQIYQELDQAGELSVRVCVWRPAATLEHFRAIGLKSPFGNSRLKLGPLKVFADGSMGAGSALFFEPYADEPTTSGLAIYPEADLVQLIQQIDAAGLQIATHAIGDKANHLVLNAYEQALKQSGRHNARHRIEHAQVVTAADLSRFAELAVIASIQPSHCIDDMRWAEKRIGTARCKNAYRFKSFETANAKIAFGTDWPVESLNPMLGLYAAVTREFAEGGPAGGWFPEEKITLAKAIEYYTFGSAYAEFSENEKGTLEAGKLADLVVLSNNLFEIDPSAILETKVLMTMVGGKVVFKGEETF